MEKKLSLLNSIGALATLFVLGVTYAFAEPNTDINTGFFTDLVNQVNAIINVAVPILIALGVLFFIWGLVQFIFASGDESAKDEGKRKMIWGVIALFVIVSVWGLVELLTQVTGVQDGGSYNGIYSPVDAGILFKE
jgi:hypothetical protein